MSERPEKGFAVEICEHGMIIRGSVPISMFDHLIEMAKSHDPTWDMMTAPPSADLNAGFVIGSSASLDRWKAEIASKLVDVADPVERWWRGPDTGMSSQYLLHCITGRYRPTQAYPRDLGDFGRCSRMLDATGLRGKLHKWLDTNPRWPSRTEWAELEAHLVAKDGEAAAKILDNLGWRI